MKNTERFESWPHNTSSRTLEPVAWHTTLGVWSVRHWRKNLSGKDIKSLGIGWNDCGCFGALLFFLWGLIFLNTLHTKNPEYSSEKWKSRTPHRGSRPPENGHVLHHLRHIAVRFENGQGQGLGVEYIFLRFLLNKIFDCLCVGRANYK